MNRKRPSYIPEDQWIEDLPLYVLKAASQYLPLNNFGFYETFRDDTDIILNSELYRMNFHARWDTYNHWSGAYEVSIYYGRLHAPDQDVRMEWRGETCSCWHHSGLSRVKEFLDEIWNYGNLSKEINAQFRQKTKEFPNQIHWRLALEAEIWQHYALRLFELFDLRRPDLWEQYRNWLKARYIAEGRSEAEDEKQGLIPYYRVC